MTISTYVADNHTRTPLNLTTPLLSMAIFILKVQQLRPSTIIQSAPGHTARAGLEWGLSAPNTILPLDVFLE